MNDAAISRKQFLNIGDAARMLATTETAIRLRVFRGRIPHFKVEGRLLFDQDELLKWVEANRRPVAVKGRKTTNAVLGKSKCQ